jgi:hypothetical protein
MEVAHVLEEIEVPPLLFRGVVEGKVCRPAFRTREPAPAWEVDRDVKPRRFFREIDARADPGRSKIESKREQGFCRVLHGGLQGRRVDPRTYGSDTRQVNHTHSKQRGTE